MAQNVIFTDEKLIPIPIGLENRYLHRNGIVSRYQKKYKNLKVHRIFYCFDIQTNKYTRLPIHNYIKQHPLAETIEFGRVSNKFYLRKLSRYDFCLAPPGNGQDTHRMWECIYLGVIPIVFESAMNNHFKSIGLPILVIKSYEDLDGFKTEQDICEMKKTIISNSNTRAAYIDYYIQLIQNYKMLS